MIQLTSYLIRHSSDAMIVVRLKPNGITAPIRLGNKALYAFIPISLKPGG